MDLSGYSIIAIIVGTVLAVLTLIASFRTKSAKRHMQDPQQMKTEKIRGIYARAKVRIEALRKERRAIIEKYEKKVNEARIDEAKKRIEGL